LPPLFQDEQISLVLEKYTAYTLLDLPCFFSNPDISWQQTAKNAVTTTTGVLDPITPALIFDGFS